MVRARANRIISFRKGKVPSSRWRPPVRVEITRAKEHPRPAVLDHKAG